MEKNNTPATEPMSETTVEQTVETVSAAPEKKKLPAFAILAIIALVAAVVLAATNLLTRGPIAEREMANLQAAFSAVLPAASYDVKTVTSTEVSSLYEAKDEQGNVIGYTVTASKNGYGGPVAVTLGVGKDGVVTGCAVGANTDFAETAGLGSRAKDEAFTSQFAGIDAVNGGSFDALSGATVTSTAVLNATNAALNCVATEALGQTPVADPIVTFGAKKEAEKTSPTLTGEVHSATAKGFASDVQVGVTLGADGTIAEMFIDATGETAGIGQNTMSDETFKSQFLGKSGPFTLGENVDAVSGATITSTAVVEAVNAALTAPVSAAAGETVSAVKKGFGGDVTVTLTVESGAITAMTVETPDETPGLGQACSESSFTDQFVGKSAPLALGEGIDAVTGATVTSTAVVDAANEALSQLGGAPAVTGEVVAQDENTTVSVMSDGTASVAVADGFSGDASVKLTAEDGKVTGGEIIPEAPAAGETTTVKKEGFGEEDVTVTVTVDAGVITALTVDASTQTPGLGQKCAEDDFTKQFIGKTLPVALGDGIDGVSGATVTSTAVVEAVNTLAAAEATATEVPATEEPAAEATEAPAAEEPAKGETTTVKKEGFGEEDVTVTVTVDAGVITALTVDASTQTAGFGQKCAEDDFTKQFIGKTLPVALGEGIDGVSGATVTSTAVVEAVNTLAAAEATVTEATATEVPATEEPAAEATEAPAAEEPAKGETTTVKKEGFGEEDITVTVTVDAGVITALTVDASTQTAGFGQKCAEDDFTKQFIGKTLPVALGDGIDGVSGATVTSTAVVEAVNTLATAAEAVTNVATATELPEGALTAVKRGFKGQDVTVVVTLDENGAIATLTVDASGETAGLGQKCAEEEFTRQFIGKTLPVALGDGIDAVSGATITSSVVVNALNTLSK